MKRDGKIGTAGKGALVSDEVSLTIAAAQDQTLITKQDQNYIIRRLTPLECERLQGFYYGQAKSYEDTIARMKGNDFVISDSPQGE